MPSYRNDICRDDMLDKIILGLLKKKDLTTYDIKIMMEKSIGNFYSNSFGSINPAIKKLEKLMLVECSEEVESGRLRKVYSITEEGLEEYAVWLSAPLTQGRIKDAVLSRIFFFEDSSKAERRRLLKEYIEELETEKKKYEEMKAGYDALDLSAKQRKQIRFQLSTLQYGIDLMAFKQTWFEELKNKL